MSLQCHDRPPSARLYFIMKHVLIFAFVWVSVSAAGQTAIVAHSKIQRSVFYYGVPNPFSAMIERAACSDLVVTSDNGSIQVLEDLPCMFQISAERTGPCHLFLSVKKNGKLVPADTVTFDVQYIPAPKAMVGWRRSGAYPVAQFRAQIGVQAVLLGFEFDARYVVTQFRLSVLRCGVQLFNGTSTGALYPSDMKEAVKAVKSGDLVTIDHINAKGPDGRLQELEPLMYMIVP